MRNANQDAIAAANSRRLRSKNNHMGFSKIGGLSNHIRLLREIIIFPLLYRDVYNHFNVKAPKGVLFYGPPGTGKTLVAGALATELSNVGNRKVTFYQRKGADILDKWVGESEKKLRELFQQAMRNRPSIIFFDELDGLAPVRSQKNDQLHCSVVATLLALMDGLDNMPGVIVIGATNRIDAIDPALRRPGRFDRELYFPLPSAIARKEILQVHTKTWQRKPTNDFLVKMAELTTGYCGSDLQALCAEAVLCSLKREYPDIHNRLSSVGTRIKIDVETIAVKEVDFLNARMNLVPTSQRLGNYRVRKLSPFIKPLLQRQLDIIMKYINILLPQFTRPFKRFLIGNERYAGRLVLKGANQQGLTVHIIPAIMQALEHIPCYMLDIPSLLESNITSARQNLPSILVLSRVDDWWDMIEVHTQLGLTAMLEDLHAGMPLFLIATCSQELPQMLQDYFYNNSSIVIKMEDPNVEERENFFAPLFFGNAECSVARNVKKENQTTSITQFVPAKVESDASKPKRRGNVSLKKQQNSKDSQEPPPLNDHPPPSPLNVYQQAPNKLIVGLKRKPDQCLPPTIPAKKPKRSTSLHPNLNEGKERLRCGGKENPQTDATKPCKLSTCKLSTCKLSTCKLSTCKVRKMDSLLSTIENSETSTTEPTSSADSLGTTQICGPNEIGKPRKTASSPTLVDMINFPSIFNRPSIDATASDCSMVSLCEIIIKQEPKSETSLCAYNPFETTSHICHNTDDPSMLEIYNLWKRAAHITSAELPVGQLELLYDIISACIMVHKHKYQGLIEALDKTLTSFESSSAKNCMEHIE